VFVAGKGRSSKTVCFAKFKYFWIRLLADQFLGIPGNFLRLEIRSYFNLQSGSDNLALIS
jgi:hypothetical protein